MKQNISLMKNLDKYSLVRKYLLNESDSMTGKEILWIHTKHDINSRNWSSFGSRNSRKLNQPYKDLCRINNKTMWKQF